MTLSARILMLTTILALALPAVGQAGFRAGDLVYVPVVAHTTGVNDSVWRSDVVITNVESEDAIDVALIFLPSGVRDNSFLFDDRTEWVGGREADSFGILEPRLAGIAPGASVILEDVVETYWPENTGSGGQGTLMVFAYLEDSLEDDGASEARNCIVHSRTFNIGSFYEPDPDNEGEFLQTEATFGQSIPGVPWYDFADAGAVTETANFSYEILDGAQENEAYRFNLGMVNGSDRQTSLTMAIEIFQPDGEPFTDDEGNTLSTVVTLPPLAHVQYNQVLDSVFGLEDVQAARLKVSIAQWTTTGVAPVPLFTSYGSLVDNGSNDPTTIHPTFEQPYDIECIWSGDEDEPAKLDTGDARPVARPVDIPAR